MMCVFSNQAVKAQQTQQNISHQGVLLDSNGDTVEDDTYIFTFRIYAESSGGSVLWESDKILDVNDGLFNAQLGSEEPLDLPFDEQYWLGIALDGGEELSPRMPLSAAPYARHAFTVAGESVGTGELKEKAVTTEKIEDGAVTSDKMAAVSAAKGKELAGITDLGTEPTNLGSITIEANSGGTVLLILSGDAVFSGEGTTMLVGLGTSEGSYDIYSYYIGNLDGSDSSRYHSMFNPTTVVNVESGTHTFYATVNKSSTFSDNQINLDKSRFSAVFIPN